jgi:competence protein ComEC
MVEPVKPRGRTAVWRPWPAAGRRLAPSWLDRWAQVIASAAQQVRAWALVETGPGRLAPWLAVAFGVGIIVYFAAEREPALWAGPSLFVSAIVIAILTRHRPVAFPIMVGIAAMAAGFTAATSKRALIAHPVLSAPVWGADVAGFVEVREERERSDRIVVRVTRIAAPRLNETLERVRVSVRKGTAPAVGSFVEFKARLSPPLSPLRPGGYDFARDMYFQSIGASGFVLGRIRLAEPDRAPPSYLRYATAIDDMREAIDERIRAVVPGDGGAIASALITGKRDALSEPVFDAMYASGIGHILSISALSHGAGGRHHLLRIAGIVRIDAGVHRPASHQEVGNRC